MRAYLRRAGIKIRSGGRKRGPELCPKHRIKRRWNGRQWKCSKCEDEWIARREEREPGYSARVHRENARRRRAEAIAAYGGICACCGESEPIFLTIDHVNGRGEHEHGKEVVGGKLYTWLKRHNYPEGFRVLCWNCNSGRALNGGVCPHEASSYRD